jgi:hypothetical protein
MTKVTGAHASPIAPAKPAGPKHDPKADPAADAPTKSAPAAKDGSTSKAKAKDDSSAKADDQAKAGAKALGGLAAVAAAAGAAAKDAAPAEDVAPAEPASSGPSTTERLEAAREHVPDDAMLQGKSPEEQERIRTEYRAEQSAMYDEVATELEGRGRPKREDFRLPNGKVMDWEYRDALAYYDSQLEEAQQGAKPERLRRLRSELAETETGREMLEFERRAGVPITIKTDAEWRRDGEDPGVLAYSSGDNGLTFNVRNLNTHVYVHEMTHQVDHRTHILAPAGDGRTRDEVVAEATKLYEQYGLDATEVPAVVDATYGQPEQGAALSHAHTRLTEARHHRIELGGEPLTEAEMREVLDQSRPREQDIATLASWNDGHDDAALLAYAQSTGIDTSGKDAQQVADEIQTRVTERESRIAAVERRGTRAEGGVGGGIGGALGPVTKALEGAKAAGGG